MGGGVAVISVSTYWIAAVLLAIQPLIANFISYVVHVTLSFIIHRSWTFKDTISEARAHQALYRYVSVSLVALAMNTAWTAYLTQILQLPAWTPTIPMVFVTPFVTFLINRYWVF